MNLHILCKMIHGTSSFEAQLLRAISDCLVSVVDKVEMAQAASVCLLLPHSIQLPSSL